MTALFGRNLDDDRPHLGPGLVWRPAQPHWRLVPWKRDPLPKSRSAAPGWQGATTEKYWVYSREAQRRQPGCPAREFGDGTRFQGTTSSCLESFQGQAEKSA